MKRNESRDLAGLIDSDIRATLHYAAGFLDGNTGLLRRLGILLMPGTMCCALHRLSHWLWCKNWRRAAGLLARINYVIHKADISPGARIGPGLYLPHTVGVLFHGHAGSGLTLYTHCQIAPRRPTPSFGEVSKDAPVLGDDVTIGAFAVVLGPARIGDAARIGPTAVIASDVAPGSAAFSRLRPRLSKREVAPS